MPVAKESDILLGEWILLYDDKMVDHSANIEDMLILAEEKLSEVRKNGEIAYLRPDGKSQVSIEYDEKGKPIRAEAIVVSTQHDPGVSHDRIKKDVIEHIIKPICKKWIDKDTSFHVNPTGEFIRGGPYADAGLTGRKIIVDTYGGVGRHGGGAFSGKDPTKVDRSAAYAARYIAKNIVAAGIADKCEIQLAYAIGVAEPVSIYIECFDTNKVPIEKIEKLVRELFPTRPSDILNTLQLRHPIYSNGSFPPFFTIWKIKTTCNRNKFNIISIRNRFFSGNFNKIIATKFYLFCFNCLKFNHFISPMKS